MKALLFYADHEMPKDSGYTGKDDIIRDLNLKVLFQAACRPVWKEGDSLKQPEKEDFFIYDTMKRMMLIPLQTEAEVLYRQAVLKEAICQPELMRQLYSIAGRAGKLLSQSRERRKESRSSYLTAGGGELLGSYDFLCKLVGLLEELQEVLQEQKFEEASALSALKIRINEEHNEEFAAELHEILRDMEFYTAGGTVIVSMGLGAGMKEEELCLKKIHRSGYQEKQGQLQKKAGKWYQKLFTPNIVPLKEEKVQREARQMETAVFGYLMSYFQDYIEDLSGFFEALRQQTAFYLGCVQLWERAASFGADFSFPKVQKPFEQGFFFQGLYEIGMAIMTRSNPVSNALEQEESWLMVVTGANQGGKSTYLRSFGIAQLMLQCGMYVPAMRFRGRLYRNVYTHFTRREDASMNSGRLEEELKRMDEIIRTVTEDSLVLLNESFATTTEKEGSAIAMELVSALYESGVTVAMVTHLLQFARELYAKKPEHAVFLSAERREDGIRTYHMLPGAPESTSFGMDLYRELIPEGNH